MNYQEIEGDIIKLAKEGKFNVIAQGCNCFCRQKSGVAKQMVEAFQTDTFPMEGGKWKEIKDYYGDINKLGQIDFVHLFLEDDGKFYRTINKIPIGFQKGVINFAVVNCYTQFKIKKFNDIDYEYTTTEIPFDYDAFALCMRKINQKFKGKHIGLPQIGSHLAGGHWPTIKEIIQTELKDCEVTIVIFKP